MLDRIEKPGVLILRNWDGTPLGVYSSFRELKDGVDYWIDSNKRFGEELAARGKKLMQTMFWVHHELDYSPEPLSFDYAYIHPPEFDTVRRRGIRNGSDPKYFKVNGPHCRERAGLNLIWDILDYDNKPSENMLGVVGMGKRIRGLNSFK